MYDALYGFFPKKPPVHTKEEVASERIFRANEYLQSEQRARDLRYATTAWNVLDITYHEMLDDGSPRLNHTILGDYPELYE